MADPSDSRPSVPRGAARRKRWLRTGGLCALGALALSVRLCGMQAVARDDALELRDPDTLRRLVRLEHLVDPSKPYPYRNPDDGYRLDPQRRGTVLHWTLPMDGVILALDPLARRLHRRAGRFEAGAAWAGPLLGTLSSVVFLLLASRWLGFGGALLAALLYTLSPASISVGAFGNGDHASLQHFGVVLALLGFLALLAGRGGRGIALLTGSGLGLALWVSTETSAVFLAMAIGALATLWLAPSGARAALAQRHLEWGAAALAVCALADRLEHPQGEWRLAWDAISGLQLQQLLVFVGFAGAARVGLGRGRGSRRWAAALAALALVVGLAPLALRPAYRETLAGELAQARAANLWAQNEISEYRPLFFVEGFLAPGQAWEHLTWLVLALPAVALGVALDRRRTPTLRAGLLLLLGALFGLACYELKLGHLFAIVYPLALVTGGDAIVTRVSTRIGAAGAAPAARWLLGLAALGCLLAADHPVVRAPLLAALAGAGDASDGGRRGESDLRARLLDELRRLPRDGGDRRAVLAPWSLGADLLYHTDHPVVASGYHRNLAGIRDAYRAFAAVIPEELDALAAILEERGVRWVVTAGDASLFVRGSRAFPELGEFALARDVEYGEHGGYELLLAPVPERTRRTFLWRAHIGGWLSRPVRAGNLELRFHAEVPAGSIARGRPPAYIIYSVREVE